MIKLTNIVILSLILTSSAVFSKSTNELNISQLKKLQKTIVSESNLAVSFTQIKYGGMRKNKKKKSTGKALFKKPNFFRWKVYHYKFSTLLSDLIYDGKHVYDYDQKSNSASVTQTKEAAKIVDVILNFNKLLDAYNLKSAVKINNDKDLELKLIPKSGSSSEKIMVILSIKKNIIKQIAIIEDYKNKTVIKFKNHNNSIIPLSKFKLPKNTKLTKLN